MAKSVDRTNKYMYPKVQTKKCNKKKKAKERAGIGREK